MTTTNMNRREQLAYLALYYAIHGDDERSEKLRMALRQLDYATSESKVAETVGV